jgi:hypothetical protein
LLESVIPDDNVSISQRCSTWVVGAGKERTAAQYADLLGKAGSRLRRMVPSVGPPSVIEAEVV